MNATTYIIKDDLGRAEWESTEYPISQAIEWADERGTPRDNIPMDDLQDLEEAIEERDAEAALEAAEAIYTHDFGHPTAEEIICHPAQQATYALTGTRAYKLFEE